MIRVLSDVSIADHEPGPPVTATTARIST
jgi:hypothetical protein